MRFPNRLLFFVFMECDTAHALIDQGRLEEETGPHASRNGLQIPTLLDTIERHGFDARLGGGRRDEETEIDISRYIPHEQIPLPGLYFAGIRDCLMRVDSLLAVSELVRPRGGEVVENRRIRFRTMGDATITGAVESTASDVESIIKEVALAAQTEGGNRADDKLSETAMEDRKREGYFSSVERTKLDFSQSLLQEPLFRSVGGQRECAQVGLLRLTSSAGASIEIYPGGMRIFGATEIVDQRLGQSQPPPSKKFGHRSTHRLAVSPRTHLVCARICLNHRDGAGVQVIHGAHDLECTIIHQRTQHLTLF